MEEENTLKLGSILSANK